MRKYYIIFTVLLAAGIAAGIYYFTGYRQAAMAFPEETVMYTPDGESYEFDDMEPKVRLLEFIYTKCPDICPNTTYKMQALRDRLDQKGLFGSEVEFLTVTIDPAADTAAVLKDYAQTFEMDKAEGWYLLRGSAKDTKGLAEQFDFLYRESTPGDFVHTSSAYLLDRDNRVVEVFGMGQDGFKPDKVYKKILKEID